MLVLATARVTKDAVKKSKERKQISSQMTAQKREFEQKSEQTLRQQKTEALKSIAINYTKSQQEAIEKQKVEEQKQKNIQIATMVGVGVIVAGVITYVMVKK
jgi:hypothetical protein